MITFSGKAFKPLKTVAEDDKTITIKGFYEAVNVAGDFKLYGGIGYRTYSKNKFGKKLKYIRNVTKRGCSVKVNPDTKSIADMTSGLKPNG